MAMLRRPSVVVVRRRPSTISKIFFSETAWPMKAKFCVEHPWVGGTKVCSRALDHMTKMADTPIYVTFSEMRYDADVTKRELNLTSQNCMRR